MRKRVLVDLFQRAGKRDFLDPTVAEAILIDTLHALLNFGAPQIVAIIESIPFNSLQRRGKSGAFYFGLIKDMFSEPR